MEKKALIPLLGALLSGYGAYSGLKSLYRGVTEGDASKLLAGAGELAMVPLGIGAIRGAKGIGLGKRYAGSKEWNRLAGELGNETGRWADFKRKYYGWREQLAKNYFDKPRAAYDAWHKENIAPLDRLAVHSLRAMKKYSLPFRVAKRDKDWNIIRNAAGAPKMQTAGDVLENFARSHNIIGGLALPVGIGMLTGERATPEMPQQPMGQYAFSYPRGVYNA